MKKLFVAASLLIASLSLAAVAGEMLSTSAADAEVYIISPVDGQIVPQTFTVKFGLTGMGVAPAGTQKDNTGHHHILIDGETLPDMSKPLPATDHIKHFGGGQTETELTLSPGKHTLQLLLGNYAHIPHDQPVLSQKITIAVE